MSPGGSGIRRRRGRRRRRRRSRPMAGLLRQWEPVRPTQTALQRPRGKPERQLHAYSGAHHTNTTTQPHHHQPQNDPAPPPPAPKQPSPTATTSQPHHQLTALNPLTEHSSTEKESQSPMELIRTVDKVPGMPTVEHALEFKVLGRTQRPTATENPGGSLWHTGLTKLMLKTITTITITKRGDEIRGNGSVPVCFPMAAVCVFTALTPAVRSRESGFVSGIRYGPNSP